MSEDASQIAGFPEFRALKAIDEDAETLAYVERYGGTFENAREQVRASIAKRYETVRRIRAIREEGRARIAEKRAAADAVVDGSNAGPAPADAAEEAPPGSAG